MERAKNSKYLLIAAICLFYLVWHTFYGTSEGSELEKSLKRQLQQTQQENDSLSSVLVTIDSINTVLELTADSLTILLVQDQQKISGLKRKQNETIQIIDSYDGHKLLRFFAELKTDSAGSK